jgi:hypothetical protein
LDTLQPYKVIGLSLLLKHIIQSSNITSIHTIVLTPSRINTPSIQSAQQPPTTNIQITDLLILGLAAFVAADCDENSNDGQDCTSSSTGTATITQTSTDVNGIVLTSLQTSTSVLVQSSFVPVSTLVSDSSTSLDVNTDRSTIRETTDVGTTPTNTIVQVETTTDVGLAGGYAYTTNSEGSTIATYTGTDDSQPRTSSITTSTAVASASGEEASSSASTTSDSFAVATAVPYIGAAAMAGLAFIV